LLSHDESLACRALAGARVTQRFAREQATFQPGRQRGTFDAMSAPTSTLPFSLVIITRDAGARLQDCIASIDFAAETLVVDSGSRDDTVQIGRRCGARVIEHDWLGFGAQKNFAVSQASNDWVLCLDADERATPELSRSIRAAMMQPRFTAYTMRRRNRFLGRWLAHGEGYPDWNLRLFDRRSARWSEDVVHEHVLPSGPVGRLEGDLLHASAESLDDYVDKQNRYTTLQAAALFSRGERSSTGRMIVSPLFRFIRFYFLRAGFLDGVPGLVHIALGCFNSFCKYAKLRALEQSERAR
jgi:glycosyltransferase involved in cell wall biosynthesis